jgi:hypothetical protein
LEQRLRKRNIAPPDSSNPIQLAEIPEAVREAARAVPQEAAPNI